MYVHVILEQKKAVGYMGISLFTASNTQQDEYDIEFR